MDGKAAFETQLALAQAWPYDAQWSCGAGVSSSHGWLVPHRNGVVVAHMDGHTEWFNASKAWSNIGWKLNPAAQ